MNNNLIEVSNLEKYFEISGGIFSRNKQVVKAVDGFRLTFHMVLA